MRKSTIPVVVALAAASVTAQAAGAFDNTAAAIEFDVNSVKAELYTVINTIGQAGASEGYVQAVKGIYLVKGSALENAITEYNNTIIAGEQLIDPADAKAKKEEFLAEIAKLGQDAADMQKPYADALTAAQNAVDEVVTAYDAMKEAINKLDVPSVRKEWLKKLEDLYKTNPAKPTSAEDKDANNKIKADAEALKTSIEAIEAQAKAADEAAKVEQASILADLVTLKGEIKAAGEAAGAEIKTLTENAGIDVKFTNLNNSYTKTSSDDSQWWKNVLAAEKNYILDNNKSDLTNSGENYKKKIATNLENARKAAKTAEDTEFVRVQNLIKAQTDDFATIKVADEDKQTKKLVTDYETALDVANIASETYHKAGTSVKNKETNEKNVEAVKDAVNNIKASVESYNNYLNVKAEVKKVQEKYNEDILRLTEKLAGNEVYQDTYAKANEELNKVSVLIKQVETENEALYVADPVSEKDAYDALISKIQGQNGTKAVDDALKLYEEQEAAKKAADEAVAGKKEGITNVDALGYIKDIEDLIDAEYKKHDLSEDDYKDMLDAVGKYVAQLALLNYTEITADKDVFATAIAGIEADKSAAAALVVYENGVMKNTDDAVKAAVKVINDNIDNLNADAKAESEKLAEVKTDTESMEKDLKAADEYIKSAYTLVYPEYKKKIDNIQEDINAIKTAADQAYTDAEEVKNENQAVRKLDLSNIKTLKDEIAKLKTDAGVSYNDRVDKSNEASYNQMLADFSDIENKLKEAETKLATYKIAELEGPDYSEEIADIKKAIEAQKTIAEEARAAQLEDVKADKHEPTLVSLLEKIDQVLYGESYPTTNAKNGGIWKDIEDMLASADAEKTAYDNNKKAIEKIEGYKKAADESIKNLKNLTEDETKKYLEDAQAEFGNNITPLTKENNEKYAKEKKAGEYQKALTEADATEKKFFEDLVNEAVNDDAYNRIVNAIETANATYKTDIDNARTDWAIQYSQLSGVYADATGVEEYQDDLNKALAGYQKRLTTDIAKLNTLKSDVATSYTEALADAKKCHDEKVSTKCEADKNFGDVYTKEINEVAEHIKSTTEDAQKNLSAFKKQVTDIADLNETYNKGLEELADKKKEVADNTADGYTSEELDKASDALKEVKTKIDDAEKAVKEQHVALNADGYANDAADEYAKLDAEMKALRAQKISDYNAEVKAENEKKLEFTKNAADDVKKVYDEKLLKIEEYGSYKHADYTENVKNTQDTFFGLADQLRQIVADAEEKCEAATKENKYFDNKELTHYIDILKVKEAIEAEYEKFIAETENIAETIYNDAILTANNDYTTAETAIKAYKYNEEALKKLEAVKKTLDEVAKVADEDKTNKVLPQNLDSYLETIANADIKSAWNDAAKVNVDKTVEEAENLIKEAADYKYEDTTPYGDEAKKIITDAIKEVNDILKSVKEAEAEKYAEITLPENMDDILDMMNDCEKIIKDAKIEADKKQKEINDNQDNKKQYDAIMLTVDELVKKYSDAIVTISGYSETVQALVDNDLKKLGGEKKDCEGGKIGGLKEQIDIAYANYDWSDLDKYEKSIKDYEDEIDDILEKAENADKAEKANGDYKKVEELHAAAYALVEPFNRAEVNKGTTDEAAKEASSIYKELNGYLTQFKDALTAYDDAKKTPETTDDEAANATLKALAGAQEFYNGKINDLAKRIEKLDLELQAYLRLADKLDKVENVDDAIEKTAADYDTYKGSVIEAVMESESYQNAVEAMEAAKSALTTSHSLNKADVDEKDINAKIDAAIAAVEAVKKATQDEYEKQTYAAKVAANDEAYNKLQKQIKSEQIYFDYVVKDINNDCKNVASDFIEDIEAIQKQIEDIKYDLEAKNKNIELTAESSLDFTKVKADIKTLMDNAKAAQEEFNKANGAAQAEVADAVKDMKALYNEALDYVQNIVITEMQEKFEEKLAAIDTNIDPSKTTTETKDADLKTVADTKAEIQKVYDEAKAAYEKWLNKGNLDGNTKVNATDYGILVDYVTGAVTPTEEQLYLADVNCDGELDVADLTNLANIILGKTTLIEINGYGVSSAKGLKASDDAAIKAQFDGKTLNVALDNDSDIAALQFDVNLPEGMTVAEAKAAFRAQGMNVYTNTLADGSVRVVLSTLAENIIEGTEGNVVDVKVSGAGFGDIELTNVIAASAKGQKIVLDDVAANNITGVKAVASAKNLNLEGAHIYNANGVETEALTSGINIVVLATGETVKVSVK